MVYTRVFPNAPKCPEEDEDPTYTDEEKLRIRDIEYQKTLRYPPHIYLPDFRKWRNWTRPHMSPEIEQMIKEKRMSLE